MDKSWKIDPWKIHGKSNAKTMGKTMENSMGNPWKIYGKSMDNKKGKKGNVSLVLHGDQKGPMETGIRFDTKWHHN